MSIGVMGVAISTTGDEHRLATLAQCIRGWRHALPLGSVIVVTVDGSAEDAARARAVVDGSADGHCGGNTYRVGQALPPAAPAGTRLGVAVNKNTGIELLMDAYVEHLFLSDDDTWPLFPASLTKHTDLGVPHSMVCWGAHRLLSGAVRTASWGWPRGVMLYTHYSVIEKVGGMDERFGPGGHEHVEWSNRICNAGLTRVPFLSPLSYALRGANGPATQASALWHCEDMPRPGEARHEFQRRKEAFTSIGTKAEDWANINKVMASHEGDFGFVPFQAQMNGRESATLCAVSSRVAGGEK